MKKKIMFVLVGAAAVGGICSAYANYVSYKKSEEKVKRLDSYYHILQQWIKSLQKGISIKERIDEIGSGKIAIYGMGVLGELLYNEMKKAGIDIVGFVDKNAEILVEGVDGLPLMPIRELESYSVDNVIVTPVFAIDEITSEIETIYGTDIKVIPMDNIFAD